MRSGVEEGNDQAATQVKVGGYGSEESGCKVKSGWLGRAYEVLRKRFTHWGKSWTESHYHGTPPGVGEGGTLSEKRRGCVIRGEPIPRAKNSVNKGQTNGVILSLIHI